MAQSIVSFFDTPMVYEVFDRGVTGKVFLPCVVIPDSITIRQLFYHLHCTQVCMVDAEQNSWGVVHKDMLCQVVLANTTFDIEHMAHGFFLPKQKGWRKLTPDWSEMNRVPDELLERLSEAAPKLTQFVHFRGQKFPITCKGTYGMAPCGELLREEEIIDGHITCWKCGTRINL